MNARERLIIALDVDEWATAERLVTLLHPYCRTFKVGFQLFTRVGPAMIEWIKLQGADVFLDLKFHDIPNTVAAAVRSAVAMGAGMFTIHCAGGSEMMALSARTAASEARSRNLRKPLLLGVTVLTNLTEKVLRSELGITHALLTDYVADMARLAKNAGLDGVVASAEEISLIRQCCGEDFIVVTPGIRPLGLDAQDQKRVATPEEAIRRGANYIVVGRPICAAEDPAEAARAIVLSMERAGH